jgi:hypothetical protein
VRDKAGLIQRTVPGSVGHVNLERIKDNLRDPSWWFTVVIVSGILGLIASVLAAFVKDYLSKILSHFSARYRAGRTKQLEERQAEVDVLVEHEFLLVIEWVRIAIQVGMIGFLGIVGVTLLFLIEIIGFRLLSVGLAVGLFVGEMVVMYKVTESLQIANNARRKYRERAAAFDKTLLQTSANTTKPLVSSSGSG